MAAGYDDWYSTSLGRLVYQVEKDLIVKMMKTGAGATALDLGCGTGVHSFMLARLGLQVTGIDISPYMLEQARAARRDDRVKFVQGDVCSLPWPEESWDLVLAVTLFEFLENPQQAGWEAWRVLRPGGELIIGVLGDQSPWTEFYRELGQKGDPVFSQARFFSPEELLNLLPGVKGEYEIGLHFGPDWSGDREKALELEREGVRARKRNGGFICGRWEK